MAFRVGRKAPRSLFSVGFSASIPVPGTGFAKIKRRGRKLTPGVALSTAYRSTARFSKIEKTGRSLSPNHSGCRASAAENPRYRDSVELTAMKSFKRNRTFRVVIATALFLVVSFNSPPTQPSVPDDRPAAPSPEEIYLLEEVAEWVLGRPMSEGFSAFSETDVVAAVRSRPRSFELFRKYGEVSSRWDLVGNMPYGDLIRSTAVRYQVDSLLLASMVEAESGFNPYAISPRGALGLMQVMPETAHAYSVDDLLEPAVNIDLGARYLAKLLRDFDGDVALALAGYNAGPGNVRRFGGMPPFRETRNYVDQVLTRYIDHHRELWQSSGDQDFLF